MPTYPVIFDSETAAPQTRIRLWIELGKGHQKGVKYKPAGALLLAPAGKGGGLNADVRIRT
jgi:hypothetical protein